MDGVQAGDMDLGFMAGIQRKGVESGDLVNLASALSEPLVQTPDAPTFGDLGVQFSADGYFVFVAPGGMDPAARDAIAAAVAEVLNAEGSKAGGFINKAFGGVDLRTGDELDAFIADAYANAGALLEASAE